MTRTNTILLAVVVAAAAAAAYWMLALSPKREQAAQLATEVAAKRDELQAAEAQLATYERARQDYRVNYAAVARLGKAVPADDDTRSLLVQLDTAAGRTRVDFRKIELGTGSSAAAPLPAEARTGAAPPPGAVSVGSAGFSAMPFAFSFRGTYGNLSEFFARLERFVTVHNERIKVTGRLLRLESLSLQPDQGGFPRIRAEIGASSYLVPPTQGLTGGATPQGPAAVTPPATAQPASAPATPAPSATATATPATGATTP